MWILGCCGQLFYDNMSYESENLLQHKNEKQIIEFVELLGYKYSGIWNTDLHGKARDFYWFDSTDYKSINGVELSIYQKNKKLIVTTRTNESRSYYDLVHQNKTIRLLKKHFGGVFTTDYGKGRYLKPKGQPLEPAASGCYLAFNSFGTNLIRAQLYFKNRKSTKEQETSDIDFLNRFNPRLISNNLLLPFLISILEDYWKSTFVVLLKYSNNKEAVLKSNKISADRLVQISKGELSVEQGFADSMSFARISIVCNHFKALDKSIAFASVLKKPYRKRKKNLFDSLEEMAHTRNIIIHEASYPIILDDDYIRDSLNILNDSIERCYRELTKLNNWTFYKSWGGPRLK